MDNKDKIKNLEDLIKLKEEESKKIRLMFLNDEIVSYNTYKKIQNKISDDILDLYDKISNAVKEDKL